MNLCSQNHEEVCYECRNCPACEWIDRLNEVRDELAATNREKDGLYDEIADLEDQIRFEGL